MTNRSHPVKTIHQERTRLLQLKIKCRQCWSEEVGRPEKGIHICGDSILDPGPALKEGHKMFMFHEETGRYYLVMVLRERQIREA